MGDNATGPWDVFDYGSTPKFSSGKKGEVFISKTDKDKLIKLATEVAGLSGRSTEKNKEELWLKHNDLKSKYPLIFCDPENGWNEIIKDDELSCEGSLAKKWEIVLEKEIFWGNYIKDDKHIDNIFNIGHTYSESGWGLDIPIHRVSSGGSYIWTPPVKKLEDIKKLKFPQIEIDHKTTEETLRLAEDIFGDILKVRLKSVWWWSLGLTHALARLRGLEKILYDMIDKPELIHELMSFLLVGTLNQLDYLENNSLLSSNTDSYVGSGGFGYTQDIIKDKNDTNIKTTNIWGFSESQETGQISPEMFKEMVFKYQLPILKRFGLNCYGCCEPLEGRWQIIKDIPHLRRVSVSPWANLEKMAECLEDKYVLSLKLNPAELAVQNINSEKIRKNIRRALNITKGCVVEFIMKDNHTLGNNPNNLIDWVKIVREEVINFYG